MLAVNSVRQIAIPSIVNDKEKDFARFVRRADIEELRAQREELAALLETEACKALGRLHNAVVSTMRDRLAILDRAISISVN